MSQVHKKSKVDEMKSEVDETKDHLAWLFPNNAIGWFGTKLDGTDKFGITYEIAVYSQDLEKMNLAGLEVEHIQKGDNDTIIIVVSDRRQKK
jgi:hypothetical protein